MKQEVFIPHVIPVDMKQGIYSNPKIEKSWNDLTLLGKNEFICYVTSAKKEETRIRRIKRTIAMLTQGKSRPCCWVGCTHR